MELIQMLNQTGHNSDWVHIPFTKKLSQSELEYLTSILLGFERQLGLVAEYMGSAEYAELEFANQRQIDAFFRNSGINQRLDELINFNASDSEQFINEFYRIGAELGYEDIQQTLAYTLADQEALFNVTKYNFDLITNVNQELKTGIREVIFNAVASGEGYTTTMRRLQELPLTPINTNISIRTRAEMIARTEYARAVNTGTLQAYANYGVDKVVINTSHDSLVCNTCLMLEEGNPYSLYEAMKFLPAHPNCRCNYAAYIPEPDELGSFDIGSLSIVNNPLVVNLCPV